MFPRLSKLDITHCPQLNLPLLPSVTQLQVTNGCSRALVGSIQNLPNLERLDLNGDGKWTSFPEEMLVGLEHLKHLRFFGLRRLKVLPTGRANLKALEQFQIALCENLETITEEASHGLRFLKRIYIINCRKFKLSAGFRHLIALEHLAIEGCGEVKDIHDALEHIMTLRSLFLSYLPNLVSLPNWLGNLGSLESLYISQCPKLTSLPMSTQSLTNLKYLEIYGYSELGKRCKEGTGEDWHKIAHVPHRVIRD
ncbi:disease resistance protein RGA2-like [Neltuma alba]|uniref:disease resistance protein RGA2-like n=1 Tax=Neltuma alba TaxID=207710 RepID=UPI0010A4C6DE|nr:disease resistance protein RGA2-like [Prosopis alba]